MLGSKIRRLAELERQLAARHEQAIDQYYGVLWRQFPDSELERITASLERREQPGYVLTAEDEAIEQRWYEAVQAVVGVDQRVQVERQEWALAWCEAVRKHG